MKKKISITISDGIAKRVDTFIDRLFIRNRSQAIESILKNALDKNKIAVILLGGEEEKLRIGDKYVPGIQIKGLPLIERQIKKLRENNFREIFVVARKKILEVIFGIMKEGAHYGVHINYIEEEINSRGSAETLKILRNRIKDTFLIFFGDIVFDEIRINDLWHSHLKNPNMATLNLITYKNPLVKGEVLFEGDKIIEFQEKPRKQINENSYLVFSPIFVCEPELMQYPGISLQEDIFPKLAKKNLLNGYVSSAIETHIHNKKDVEKANAEIKLKSSSAE